MNIISITTAWGAHFGGINSFNRDFLQGLSTLLCPQHHIFSVAFNPSPEDVEDAKSIGIAIIPLTTQTIPDIIGKDLMDPVKYFLDNNYPGLKISLCLGHDVISGEAAIHLSSLFDCNVAVIMHMSYIDYHSIKSGDNEDTVSRHRLQTKIFQNKKVNCFAVGPLLRDACSNMTGTNVTMLVPGFPSLPTLRPPKDKLAAITFGRMDSRSDKIKQGRLAAAGFALACKEASELPLHAPLLINPRFFLIGAEKESLGEESISQFAQRHAERTVNIFALPYDPDRNNLFLHLAETNLAFMLSWHEGFGLAGWEAIAAEIPLIVSKNSGLYKLVEETLLGAGTGCLLGVDIHGNSTGTDNFTAEDVQNVKNKVLEVASNLSYYQANARELKRQLQDKLCCTWEGSAKTFVNSFTPEETIAYIKDAVECIREKPVIKKCTYWDYVNSSRFFAIASTIIRLDIIAKAYSHFKAKQFILDSGFLNSPTTWGVNQDRSLNQFDSFEGADLCRDYVNDIINLFMYKVDAITIHGSSLDLPDQKSKDYLGNIVIYDGPYTISPGCGLETVKKASRGQFMNLIIKSNHFNFNGIIDLWECVSSSGRQRLLPGSHIGLIVIAVSDLAPTDLLSGGIEYQGTILLVGRKLNIATKR